MIVTLSTGKELDLRKPITSVELFNLTDFEYLELVKLLKDAKQLTKAS